MLQGPRGKKLTGRPSYGSYAPRLSLNGKKSGATWHHLGHRSDRAAHRSSSCSMNPRCREGRGRALRWSAGVGEGGKRLSVHRGVDLWSQLGGGSSDSSPSSAACRQLLPAKFRRLRPGLDGLRVLRVRGEGGECVGVVEWQWEASYLWARREARRHGPGRR